MSLNILILTLSLICSPNRAQPSAFHHDDHIDKSFKSLKLPSSVGSEALAFDPANNGPYTGLNDGRVVKYDATRKVFVDFATTVDNRSKKLCDGKSLGRQCGRPLDLEFNHKTGELYIVDVFQGLMVVGPEGGAAIPVARGADGMPGDAPDAISIDPITGDVYFTDIGTIFFTNSDGAQVLQSGDTSGRLLKFNPKTKRRSVVMTGLAGPAGLAISQDGSFILIAEYLECRITRFWLRGPRATKSNIFVQLPGNPDNIKRTISGDFWVSVNLQKLYPQLISFPLGQKISACGQIIKTINFYTEYNATYITEVHEHLGRLYVTSIFTDFVGVYNNTRLGC